MKILVTGGAGYIGSVCTDSLIARGDKVIVFDNLSEGNWKAVHPEAVFINGDLNVRTSIVSALKAAQPDAVVHFAANALVGESMEDPYKYFRNNVGGTLNLLEGMKDHGVKRLVFSSTCATFGIPDVEVIEETTLQGPINPYGESKLMVERMLRWYSEIFGLTFASLRYFNVAGATERLGEVRRVETHLIPRILQAALGKAPAAEIYGTDFPTPDGTCIRDYIHVQDLVDAHLLALNIEKSAFFNLGTETGTSVREVIGTARAVTGREIPAIEKPRRAGDPAKLVASSRKAREMLGWKPRYGIGETVESAWKWLLAHPQGYARAS
jgi:UDP-glucose 4-epimerase